MSFAGLSKGVWNLYVVRAKAAGPDMVGTVSEPKTPTLALQAGRAAYIAADGGLHEVMLSDATDTLLLAPTKRDAYTQPAYTPDGESLFVVVLKQGASVDTDILAVKRDHVRQRRYVTTQRSAQFEPYLAGEDQLYYSSVHCTVGCGKIIQEIWRKHLVTGEAGQVTLLNAVSREPVVSADGVWLYFSSNAAGNYHIWRQSQTSGAYEQLTQGYVTDVTPALDAQGQLYFIRRSPEGVQLMRYRPGDAPLPLPLPGGMEDIRDLEISR